MLFDKQHVDLALFLVGSIEVVNTYLQSRQVMLFQSIDFALFRFVSHKYFNGKGKSVFRHYGDVRSDSSKLAELQYCFCRIQLNSLRGVIFAVLILKLLDLELC